MRALFVPALVVSSVVLLTACNEKSGSTASVAPAVPAIDQANLCETTEWRFNDVASVCKPGQKVAFLPNSWGNEQLPVLFAAVNCDLRYNVVQTKGGVTCIYGPITPKPPAPAKAE